MIFFKIFFALNASKWSNSKSDHVKSVIWRPSKNSPLCKGLKFFEIFPKKNFLQNSLDGLILKFLMLNDPSRPTDLKKGKEMQKLVKMLVRRNHSLFSFSFRQRQCWRWFNVVEDERKLDLNRCLNYPHFLSEISPADQYFSLFLLPY